jgi:NADH pyrophosphatase NudC (nudix superfamily)
VKEWRSALKISAASAARPWLFPGQPMLGFIDDYDAGEIPIEGVEISNDGWYHYRHLPIIPGVGTIANPMIRWQVEKHFIHHPAT